MYDEKNNKYILRDQKLHPFLNIKHRGKKKKHT